MDYPKTRMDNFFAKAAGSELADNDMVPITDREYWINEMAAKIAQGGGGGGGGNTVYINYDADDGSIDASFNELLGYFNDGKLVFTKYFGEDDGTTTYMWTILTRLQRISYDQSITYMATVTAFDFFDGSPIMQPIFFVASDPDEKMIID